MGIESDKRIKVISFVALFVAASYFFGDISHRIGEWGSHNFSPTSGNLYLLLWLIVSAGLVVIVAGFVAVLLCPFWLSLTAFVLSALVILVQGDISLLGIVTALAYVVTGLFYCRGVRKGLEERIRFSVRAISENQTILLLILATIACFSLYSGYAAQIRREGFSLPPSLTDFVLQVAGEQGVGSAELRQNLGKQIQGAVKPYEGALPSLIAITLFGSLVTLIPILSWIPTLTLRVLFSILVRLRVIRVVTETREVVRLTL